MIFGVSGINNMKNVILCGGRVEIVEIIHDKCIAKFIVHLDRGVLKNNMEEVGRKYVHFALTYLINEGIINKSIWKTYFTTIISTL